MKYYYKSIIRDCANLEELLLQVIRFIGDYAYFEIVIT